MAEIFIPSASDSIISQPGEYSVPSGSNVLDLVYISGSKAADVASNVGLSTVPAKAVIIVKPAVLTATLLFSGVVDGFAGLTPGEDLFLGVAGAVVNASGLPTTPGEIIQKVGVAVSPSAILFFPNQVVVL